MQHSALLNVMIAAARRAARTLKRDFGEVENLQVSLKGPGNFVTAADRKAEETLKAELAKPPADGVRHRVIFQHHSWFLENAGEPDQYFNIPLVTRKRYLKLFHDSGITHVFAGHYHRNSYARDGSLEMITTGPVSKPLGKDPSGIRVVIWNETGFTHEYYGLGSIPHEVSARK